MTRLNTTEANAGLDLTHLARCIRNDGNPDFAYIGEHFGETPGWGDLAADVLRLTALVADLTTANAALAADNARLGNRVDAARGCMSTLTNLNGNHSPFGGEIYRDRVDRAWDDAIAWLAGGDA